MNERRTTEPWTVRRVVRWSAEDFAQRGLASPRLDAELLVARALGLTRVQLYMDLERVLVDEELAAVRALVQRRRKHEPVAYLLGEKEFWGRSFQVDASVLVPRPETETLVERALALLPGDARKRGASRSASIELAAREPEPEIQREAASGVPTHVERAVDLALDARQEHPSGEQSAPFTASHERSEGSQAHEAPSPGTARILDLGTGSGCIGLTLACERSTVEVVLTDLSRAALAVARANLARFAERDPTLRARVTLHEGDLFAAVPAGARFDLVTCNPPYLSENELAEVDRDVREHEPRDALVAGPRGDEILARLAAEVGAWLAPGGVVLTEIGVAQGARVRRLFEAAGLCDVRVHQDLSGRDRVVEGRAPRA